MARPQTLHEQVIAIKQLRGINGRGRLARRGMTSGRQSCGFAHHREVPLRVVALIVAQQEGEMVGPLFVEGDDATMDIRMEDRQTHVALAIGLHIPGAMMAPMVVVTPQVDLWLTADGDAVDIAAKHLATIDQQLHVADAVVMINTLRIVVGPEGKAHLAPCREGARERPSGVVLPDVGHAEAESLLAGAPIEPALSLYGNGHEGMSLRRHGVGNKMSQEGHGVAHHPRLGVVNLQVQMWTCRVARIAADGNEVASTDGELRRWENHRQRVFRTRALQQCFILRCKALQMAVDAGMAIWVSHIDGIAEAIHVDGEPADVAIRNGIDIPPLAVLCLDIDAPMKVPGARLTEVARKNDGAIDGTVIFDSNIADRLGLIMTTACQQQYAKQY